MFKALIVDDERLDREGLKGQVQWDALAISVVETAKSGFEALDIIHAIVPDILITDVKMPGMNGLSLAQKATELVPWIKIIFISGFDDFEYVRNALLINAYEYILKPVDTPELLSALKNVVNERIKEIKAREENKELQNKVSESRPLLKHKLFCDMLYGTAGREDIETRIKSLELKIHEGLYRVLLCELDDYKIILEELPAGELEKLQEQIFDLLEHFEVPLCIAESVQIEKSRYAVILNYKEDMETSNINTTSHLAAERIIAMVKDHTGMSVTLGMGSVVNGMEALHISYDDSCQALLQKMLAGKGSVLEYLPKTSIKEMSVNFQNTANELIQCIKTADLPKVYYLIDHLFDDLEAGNIYGNKYIQNCCINIISRMEITLLEMNERVENIFGEEVILWDKLMKYETILDIRQWMKNIFRAVMEYFENRNSRKNRKIITAVIKYMEENYYKELTLKDIAGVFFYSPNYLGSVFKEELGLGFFEYLTDFRMKKAAEFLRQPGMKMYEIANHVGYKNVSSFINQFKLSYNMTPTEFRERL